MNKAFFIQSFFNGLRRSACEEKWGRGNITATMLCTMYVGDLIQDPGDGCGMRFYGPLIKNDRRVHYHLGVWGKRCHTHFDKRLVHSVIWKEGFRQGG